MNIFLTEEQQQFVTERIQNGKYNSVDEVIAQAFKLLEEEEINYNNWLNETRQKVALGIEQADKGQLTDGKLVIEKLRSKLREKAGGSQA